MPKGCNWTEELCTELARRWDLGESAGILCKVFGVSRSAIVGKVDRLRKQGRIKRLVDQQPRIFIPKPRPAFVARKPPVHTRKKHVPKAKLVINGVALMMTSAWTAEQTYAIIDAWNGGMTAPDLAQATNRTLKSIEAKLRQLMAVGLCRSGLHRPRRIVEKPHTVASLRVLEERKVGFQQFGQSALALMESTAPGTGQPIETLKRNQCRWPTGGEAPQWLFCGSTINDGVKSSYCTGCRPRMYPGGFSALRSHVEAA